LSALIAVALFVALLWTLSQVAYPLANVPVPESYLITLGRSFVDPNQYALPFEVASVLLLVALIGSIVIAGEKGK